MISTFRFRLTTLHLAHRFFTDADTFIFSLRLGPYTLDGDDSRTRAQTDNAGISAFWLIHFRVMLVY